MKTGEKNNPKVTVITITYNLVDAGRADTIRQCIESVHNQTYENIEHLIIDGDSNDGTLEIIKEYEEKGCVTCHCEKDTGIYNAFNKGILKASGEYIIFLNSDDFYNSKFGIEKSVKALLKSGADYSYAPIFLLNETKPDKSGIFKPKTAITFNDMPFGHQSMLCKKSVFIKEGMFNENYKLAGDYDFIIRLKLKGYKGVLINHVFTTFRTGGLSEIKCMQSKDECRKIHKTLFGEFSPNEDFSQRDFSPALFFKLLRYHSFQDKIILLCSFMCKWLLEFRISKHYPKLKIFGLWIIKPKES